MALALCGCIPDSLRIWEGDWELPAIPSPTPEVHPPGDLGGDPGMATARFGFIMLAVGAVAGVIALQSWLQLDNDKQVKDKGAVFFGKWEGAVMVPIAAFGLGVGVPIYTVSVIMASRELERAQRKKLGEGKF